jgi:hypothetical protein
MQVFQTLSRSYLGTQEIACHIPLTIKFSKDEASLFVPQIPLQKDRLQVATSFSSRKFELPLQTQVGAQA